jgi:hypothetical protein
MAGRQRFSKVRQRGTGRVVRGKSLFARRVGLALVCLHNEKRLNLPLENVARLLHAKGFRKIGAAVEQRVTRSGDHLLIGGWQKYDERGQDHIKIPRGRVGEAFVMLQQQGVIDARLEALGATLDTIHFPGIAHAIRDRLEVHGNV